MRFNLPVCADRYAQIATAFGLAEKNEELSAERLVDEVHAMSRRINIPRFIDLGIDPPDHGAGRLLDDSQRDPRRIVKKEENLPV